jgi:hypothetical protein
MSNVQSRAELMNLIESMLGTARKYGYKESSDVITQALFADTLEKILGTEAPTSLLGQAARSQAGREAASGVSDIAMGGARGKVTGGAKILKAAGKFLGGGENKQKLLIEALRKLLK